MTDHRYWNIFAHGCKRKLSNTTTANGGTLVNGEKIIDPDLFYEEIRSFKIGICETRLRFPHKL